MDGGNLAPPIIPCNPVLHYSAAHARVPRRTVGPWVFDTVAHAAVRKRVCAVVVGQRVQHPLTKKYINEPLIPSMVAGRKHAKRQSSAPNPKPEIYLGTSFVGKEYVP